MLKKRLKEYWFAFLILLVITVIAYGQTLWMYFLIDDNALIYKLQHLNTYSGFWGKGLFGEGPYRHIADQFVPFYPVFKVNPTPYFAVGVFLYFLSSVALYLFTKAITKNNLISFAVAAIFAAGYIGSESMFGITNSWQTTRGIIMALGVLWLFYKFKSSGKFVFYALSVLLFFFSLDTVYVRAHGLIFGIFFFDLIFWPVLPKLKSITKFLVRQLPFLIIHYYIYIAGSPYVRELGVLRLFNEIFLGGRLVLVSIPIQDIGNLFIPDLFTSNLDRAISHYISLPSEFSPGSLLAGLFIISIFTYLVLKNIKRENLFARLLIFSAIFAGSNFIAFWARETGHTLWTTHRYFLYSSVGVALFWAISFYLISKQLKKKKLFKILTTGIIVSYLWLGINYQHSFNLKRSFPVREFIASFAQAVPKIPKDAVIYFNVANDNEVLSEYGSFFGGMFSEAGNLAILGYVEDYTSDFLVTYKMDEIKNLLAEGRTTTDKVYAFYYGKNGLVDTSQQTRELLEQGKVLSIRPVSFSSNTPFVSYDTFFNTETLFSESDNKAVSGENSVISVSFTDNTPSIAPSTFSFSMSVAPKIPPLPYQDSSKAFSVNGKNKVFSYLLSQSGFRKTAMATSASFWKEQEPKLAIDGRLETSWRGHRGFWDNIDRGITQDVEYLNVDLGRTLTVGQVRWVSAQRPLVPIHYKILTSLDGKLWDLVKEVTDGKALPEETVVVDSFNPTPARFIKMEVLKTYGNDGPELKEFELVESRFTDLDRRLVEKVKQAPFAKIETLHDFNDALTFIRQNASLRFYYQSSADSKQDPTKYVDVPLLVDGKSHEYSIPLPATGISWTQFTLEGFNFPADIVIEAPKITYESVSK